MIIWLNGAFGAGKTQTAFELRRRLPNSYVYDPENAGFFIRDNLPPGLERDDFQDFPMWRAFNRDMLDYAASRYDGHIIVPMTVTNRAYYDELVGALAQKHQLRHFILWSSAEALRKRLASRLEGPGSWGSQQIGRCLRAFEREVTEEKVYTDNLNIGQAADKIGELCGLKLTTDQRNPVRRWADRLAVHLGHIR